MLVDPEVVVVSPLAVLVETVPVSHVERAKAGIAMRQSAITIIAVFIEISPFHIFFEIYSFRNWSYADRLRPN